MDIKTLEQRIQKNEEKIVKKQNTIQKKEKSIEKKIATLKNKYSLDYDGERLYTDELRNRGLSTTEANEAYWIMCDIDYLKDDLKRLPAEIEETKAVLEKQRKQLAGEIKKDALLTTEIPEKLQQYQRDLVTEWDEFDKAKRQRYRDEYKELSYTEFVKKHRYAGYAFMQLTDAEIHKSNENDAKKLILNLINRVKGIVGEITDYSHLDVEPGNGGFAVITGYVVGTTGRAQVETILAGGYNIQRLHIRTLVKEIH